MVLTCGTFLNGLIHIGSKQINAGRYGEKRAEGITESLNSLGLKNGRLKTGTPPRIKSLLLIGARVKLDMGIKTPLPCLIEQKTFLQKMSLVILFEQIAIHIILF